MATMPTQGSRSLPLVAGLALLLSSCGNDAPERPTVPAPTATPPAATALPTITIDPAKDRGAVNRLVFGHNIEAGNGKDIFSSKKDTNDPRAGRGAWDVEGRKPIADTVAWSKAIGMGMLRYPGGCLTHNFDWKQAVGPLSERTYYTFGVDEYLTFCRAVGCEPLMNVSEIADPADAAALVEYLNAPADAAHPWAQKRAAWGHPEPWKVVWFEMANESDHGNHQVDPHLQRTAAEYAQWVLDAGTAMRKVDPAIKLGAHMGTGTPVSDPWNRTVLEALKTRIDFVAVHTYAVGSPHAAATPEQVGRACMAVTAQIGALLGDYRALIRQCTGADIPLAVTEYNAGFSAPDKPWRFSYAAAFHSADQLRLMLEPEANVVMAHYWQYLNGYWGFLRGNEVPKADVRWTTTAAAPVYRLWGEHVGSRLVASGVSGVARLEFEGFKGVFPARGDQRVDPRPLGSQPLTFATASHGAVAVTSTGPGTATIVATALTGEHYPNQPSFPVVAGHTYRLRWEQRIEGDSAGFSPGMGLCDARGWNATHSACGSSSGEAGADGWASFQTEMRALPDAQGLMGVLRLIGSSKPVTATIRIRNARVEQLTPRSEPAFDAVTTHASLSADGRTLHLVVFNKHHDRDLPMQVRLADGSAKGAKAWSVSGPFEATNMDKGKENEVRETLGGRAVEGVKPDGFAFTFPARSMTAIDIVR